MFPILIVFNYTNIVSDQLIKVVYNLDSSTNDTSKCSHIIFTDNFNNNTFDTNFWKRLPSQLSDIRVEDSILKLEQNVTDKNTNLHTKWVNIDTGSVITMERKVKVHYNNRYGYAGARFLFNNISNGDSGQIAIIYFDNLYENDFGIYFEFLL